MATTFGDFIQLLVRRLRGDDKEAECAIAYVSPRSPAGRPGCTGRVSLHTPQAPTSAGPRGHPGKPGHPEAQDPKSLPFGEQAPRGNSEQPEDARRWGRLYRGRCCLRFRAGNGLSRRHVHSATLPPPSPLRVSGVASSSSPAPPADPRPSSGHLLPSSWFSTGSSFLLGSASGSSITRATSHCIKGLWLTQETERPMGQREELGMVSQEGLPWRLSCYKESSCNARDLGLIPGLGSSSGEGKGYPLQHSGLESMGTQNVGHD